MAAKAAAKSIFTRETFRFFRDLAAHNRRVWMDANRERYQSAVVQPLRRLLEELSPAVLRLDSRFETTGRAGANFSRINRDIRFAKDKTLYRTQMYLKFSPHFSGGGETGQLYTGISADTVTVGFRIYSGSKRRESTLGQIAEPRTLADPRWLARQKKRLARRYDSYWYSAARGEWKKHDGWPVSPDDWKKLQGWVVRRKLSPSAATLASFPRDVAKIFRELFPLLRFTSLPN
jgi:uncharacterized protein (TIGR02453 family)